METQGKGVVSSSTPWQKVMKRKPSSRCQFRPFNYADFCYGCSIAEHNRINKLHERVLKITFEELLQKNWPLKYIKSKRM